jgi:hypothetical protein
MHHLSPLLLISMLLPSEGAFGTGVVVTVPVVAVLVEQIL